MSTAKLLAHAEAMLAAAVARMDPLGITPPELRLEIEQWGAEVKRLKEELRTEQMWERDARP